MDISLGQNTMYHFIHPSIKGQIKIKNNTKVLGRQPEPENLNLKTILEEQWEWKLWNCLQIHL